MMWTLHVLFLHELGNNLYLIILTPFQVGLTNSLTHELLMLGICPASNNYLQLVYKHGDMFYYYWVMFSLLFKIFELLLKMFSKLASHTHTLQNKNILNTKLLTLAFEDKNYLLKYKLFLNFVFNLAILMFWLAKFGLLFPFFLLLSFPHPYFPTRSELARVFNLEACFKLTVQVRKRD